MDTCQHCNKVIQVGEARYTAGEYSNPPRFAHWDCHAKKAASLKQDLAELKGKIAAARVNIQKLRR